MTNEDYNNNYNLLFNDYIDDAFCAGDIDNVMFNKISNIVPGVKNGDYYDCVMEKAVSYIGKKTFLSIMNYINNKMKLITFNTEDREDTEDIDNSVENEIDDYYSYCESRGNDLEYTAITCECIDLMFKSVIDKHRKELKIIEKLMIKKTGIDEIGKHILSYIII
jgi:hypothetical protein